MARTSLSRIFPSISNLSINKLSSTTARSESIPRSVSNSVNRLLSSESQPNHDKENAKKEKDEIKENLRVKNKGEEEDDDDENGYDVNEETGEIGGPKGPEPTRYGDWERNGRCYDF